MTHSPACCYVGDNEGITDWVYCREHFASWAHITFCQKAFFQILLLSSLYLPTEWQQKNTLKTILFTPSFCTQLSYFQSQNILPFRLYLCWVHFLLTVQCNAVSRAFLIIPDLWQNDGFTISHFAWKPLFSPCQFLTEYRQHF